MKYLSVILILFYTHYFKECKDHPKKNDHQEVWKEPKLLVSKRQKEIISFKLTNNSSYDIEINALYLKICILSYYPMWRGEKNEVVISESERQKETRLFYHDNNDNSNKEIEKSYPNIYSFTILSNSSTNFELKLNNVEGLEDEIFEQKDNYNKLLSIFQNEGYPLGITTRKCDPGNLFLNIKYSNPITGKIHEFNQEVE